MHRLARFFQIELHQAGVEAQKAETQALSQNDVQGSHEADYTFGYEAHLPGGAAAEM